LYYLAPDGNVMAVEVSADATFHAGIPKPLFQTPSFPSTMPTNTNSNWDVASDGNRFLLAVPTPETSRATFTVILNWTALLKK
jgi:hypothetical protein